MSKYPMMEPGFQSPASLSPSHRPGKDLNVFEFFLVQFNQQLVHPQLSPPPFVPFRFYSQLDLCSMDCLIARSPNYLIA